MANKIVTSDGHSSIELEKFSNIQYCERIRDNSLSSEKFTAYV